MVFESRDPGNPSTVLFTGKNQKIKNPVNQQLKGVKNALVRLCVDRIFWSVMNGLTLTFSTKIVLFSLSDTYFTTK